VLGTRLMMMPQHKSLEVKPKIKHNSR
jgi:hypothetical protein